MAAPLIIIHPDIADDPAFQNDVVLTTFTAAGVPSPVPAGTMTRLAAYESKTLSDIDASLSRKDAAVVLRHRVTHEIVAQPPALGLQGIQNHINALAVAVQQMGQQLNQRLDAMNQRLDTLERGAEQARAIHMNKSTFEDGHRLGAVKSLGGEDFPGGMALNRRTLSTINSIKLLNVGQLNSWLDFYGIPVPNPGSKNQKVKRLVNFLGGSSRGDLVNRG